MLSNSPALKVITVYKTWSCLSKLEYLPVNRKDFIYFSRICFQIRQVHTSDDITTTRHLLSFIYVSDHNAYQSGAGMATLLLAVGGTVSLKSLNNNKVIHPYSCYTLIKIK